MSTEQGQFDQATQALTCRDNYSFAPTAFSPELVGGNPVFKSGCRQLVSRVFLWVATLLVVSATTGCQQIYLPRIDPNGSSVFLPFPNTTKLAIPALHSRGDIPGFFPDPAFAEPPAPPACLDGGDGEGGICNMFKNKLVGHIQSIHKSPGSCGELQLSPLRVVAPVGGEVVLLAGICGKDGYLVKREPLEWMLSPDSVGTFIEVGDDARSQTIRALRRDHKVEKLDVDFARGRTSNRQTLITRGSPSPNDDIKLLEGQTWLSISSPSEGISRVTALAPESDIWDQRRQTATIYWVDAQWEFPEPKSALSGDSVELTTRVTKAERLKPARGWEVVYTIVDPSVAVFAPPADPNSPDIRINGNAATVLVDQNGQANVRITAPPNTRGTTPVVIEVYRPAEPSDSLPRLLLGRGQTIVTFSAPSLALQAFGPETGMVNEPLTYSVTLANAGDRDAENVDLAFRVPAGMRMVQSSLAPNRQTQDALVWEQGILPAQRQVDITLVLVAQQTGDYNIAFAAQGAGLQAQSSVATRIIQPSVNVRFQPVGGVAQAEVGGRVEYEIDIENTGTQALSDLLLLIKAGPGLSEVSGGGSQVEQRIGILQPRETRQLGVVFNVQREGNLEAVLQVVSGAANDPNRTVLAERTANILGLPPQPKRPGMEVTIAFPSTVEVGRQGTAEITLKNTGQTTLTGLNVVITNDASLDPTRVNPENRANAREEILGQKVVWTPQDLMQGTYGNSVIQIKIEYDALSPAAQANILVQATCNEQVRDEARAVTRIVGGNVLPPADAGQTVPQRSGELLLSLNDFDDPRTIGQRIRYGLRITNDQNSPARNVRVQLRVPQGLDFEGAIETLKGESLTFQRDGDILELRPLIQFLRAGESVDYTLYLVGRVTGTFELGARVAQEQGKWKAVSETTTINPR